MIILMAVSLLWTGCKNEGMNEPIQTVTFPISISLPAEDVYEARLCSHRRALGDPGTTESFELPNYIYIIVMKKTGESTWALWRVITESDAADEGKWTKQHYGGLLQTLGDSIYLYNKEFSELLDPGEANFNGRVYAVASKEELTFDKALNNTGITSLSDLENLTFEMNPAVQSSVQHIYATPYNYIVNGAYYGSFSSLQKVPHVSLMLYHVAAKVDIKWNVADSVRIKADPTKAVRLTYMKACNLFNGNAYCFKPMSNTAAEPVTSTDSVTIITPADEGLWWEGRSYFYTIPYTTLGRAGHFPLQMKMGTNDSTKYYKPTIYLNIENDTTFVPWLRVNFNLTQPLTEGSRDI